VSELSERTDESRELRPAPAGKRGEPMTGQARSDAEAAVLEVVRALIGGIIGEQYLLDLTIDLETSFEDDLEMESIEFVKLGAKLTEYYGGNVDFAGFLADLDLDEIIGMRVGTVVGYVVDATT
jgi:acyl carrier protein